MQAPILEAGAVQGLAMPPCSALASDCEEPKLLLGFTRQNMFSSGRALL